MSRTPLLIHNLTFLRATFVGSLVFGVLGVLAPAAAQIGVLGVYVSALAGLLLAQMEWQADDRKDLRQISQLIRVYETLIEDEELLPIYQRLTDALSGLSEHSDPVLRQTALTRLLQLCQELEAMADGTFVFGANESWRTVYEDLLQVEEVKKYRSAAWVKTRNYWQDAAGQQSMEANFAAIDGGTLIERCVILPDALWPSRSSLPTNPVLSWLMNQHNQGVWVTLVLESDLNGEPDLPLDFGIYGDRAVGVQTLDENSRTAEFRLEFSPAEVRLAEDRWARLNVHAVAFQDLLDR